jgi:ABC-type nitrate/sulfonate/bicarbonate transport system permease component
VLVGSRALAAAAMPLFQLLRMISPLSWMPLAVMVLGVGDAPVYFLLAFAAVWPILLNTATGVAARSELAAAGAQPVGHAHGDRARWSCRASRPTS